MIRGRLVLGLLMCLMFSLTVNAYTNTSNDLGYWTLDQTLADSTPNSKTLINVSSTSTTGKINQSNDFDGSSGHLTSATSAFNLNGVTDFSVSFWVYADSWAAGQRITEKNNDVAFAYIFDTDSTNVMFQVYDGSTVHVTSYPTASLNTGQWYHFVGTYSTTGQIEFWIDNVEVDNAAGGSGMYDNNFKLYLGTGAGGSDTPTGYFNGRIDEYYMVQNVLTTQNISDIYNSGNGIQYPFTLPAPNKSITIDANTVTGFNQFGSGVYYTKNNLTITTNLSVVNTNTNINGTYNLFRRDNSTLINNNTQYMTNQLNNTLQINFTAEGTYDWNATYFNNETSANQTNLTFVYDITAPTINVIGNLTQNAYSVNFSNIINVTDTLSGPDTCTINITYLEANESDSNFFINCTDTQAFTRAGLYNWYVEATDLAGNIGTLSVNGTINPFIFVYFFDINNVSISNYNATISHPDGRVTPILNTNNPVNLSPVNDGELDLGIHNITFEKFGYTTQTVSVLVNATNAGRQENFTINNAEIVVTIRDKETGSIVSGPLFNLEFIATVGLVTNTTTGTKTINNTFFRDETYELRTTSTNYTAESIFFNFSNREVLPVTVYVIDENSTNYGVVEVKVVDKFGKSVTGALVKALQWDSNTSSYIATSQGLTAEDGKSILNIVLDDKQYIFSAQFGSLSKNTTPQFIPTILNGKLIVISLDVGATEFDSFLDFVDYNITESFVNNISNITFSWTTDGTDITGFINYYRLQSTGERTLIDANNQTGSTVILSTSNLLNSSYYIIADVGFIVDGGVYVQKSYNYPPVNDISQILENTNLSIFLMPLLYLAVVLIGMANVFIGAILLIVVSGISLTLFPQYMTPELVAFFYLLGVGLMAGGAKRR